MKTNFKIGFGYWFVHFTVEVMCFYTIYRLFDGGSFWWIIALAYDTLAFAPQAAIGDFCEKHPQLRPGRIGFILLIAGSALMILTSIIIGDGAKALFWVPEIIGLAGLTIGNASVHIDGALVTLRVSDGRLAEVALFVGGGSFGVITGRLLSSVNGIVWLPFVLAALGLLVAELARISAKKAIEADKASANDPAEKQVFDFKTYPCKQHITANRPIEAIIIILGLVVVARAYIGYGLPTAWNRTTVQTVFLFVFMGLGKMAGGILADKFGARNVGVASCLLAVPLLLVSNNIMWLSLIAVALFSMTMAITLGGLVSVLPENPGVAFGITTIGLLIGSVPPFFWGIPVRRVSDILIVFISVLAAAGLWYCLKKKEGEA